MPNDNDMTYDPSKYGRHRKRTPESQARLEYLRTQIDIDEILDWMHSPSDGPAIVPNPNYDAEVSRATLESPSAGAIPPGDDYFEKLFTDLASRDAA